MLQDLQDGKTPGMNRATTRRTVCEKHGEYSQRVMVISFTGTPIFEGCPKCAEEDEERRREERTRVAESLEAAERERKIQALENMGIRKRFYATTFDTFIPSSAAEKRVLDACRGYAGRKKDVAKTGENLFLVGRPGTGKNHLAVSIIREWSGERKILKLAEMVRDIRQAYANHTNEQTDIERYARLDLLALNEVGVQFGTDAERNLLFEVLDLRYENMLPTILVSNLNVAGIKDYVGGRVIDRLMECAQVVEFTWDSYRGNSK